MGDLNNIENWRGEMARQTTCQALKMQASAQFKLAQLTL